MYSRRKKFLKRSETRLGKRLERDLPPTLTMGMRCQERKWEECIRACQMKFSRNLKWNRKMERMRKRDDKNSLEKMRRKRGFKNWSELKRKKNLKRSNLKMTENLLKLHSKEQSKKQQDSLKLIDRLKLKICEKWLKNEESKKNWQDGKESKNEFDLRPSKNWKKMPNEESEMKKKKR